MNTGIFSRLNNSLRFVSRLSHSISRFVFFGVILTLIACGGGPSSDGNSSSGNGGGTANCGTNCIIKTVCTLGVGCWTIPACINSCPVEPANQKPVASVAAPATSTVGTALLLDSTASDPDGDPLSYQWAILSKPASSTINITDDTVADLSVTPDAFGRYVLSLVVDDGEAIADTQFVMVDVEGVANKDFVLTTELESSSNTEAVAAIAADLDGNPEPDLVIGRCDGKIETALNDGSDDFDSQDIENAFPFCNSVVVVADFDGDAKNDLVSFNVLLKGDGAGNLSPLSTFGFSVTNLAAGDFNNDGNSDLALVKTDGGLQSVLIMQSNGDGTFTEAATFFSPSEIVPLAVSDFNNDGIDDLVFYNALFDANGNSEITVLLGNVTSNFSTTQMALPGKGAMGTGDVNSDGDMDLVVSYRSGTLPDTPPGLTINVGIGIATLLGNGDGSFEPVKFTNAANLSSTNVAIYDFTEDGNPDLVYLGDSGMVNVLVGDGGGGYSDLILIETTPVPSFSGFNIGEIDGDNRPEILLSSGLGSGSPNEVRVAYGIDNHLP